MEKRVHNKLMKMLKAPKYHALSAAEKKTLIDTWTDEYHNRLGSVVMEYITRALSSESLQVLGWNNKYPMDAFIQVHTPKLRTIIDEETKNFIQALINRESDTHTNDTLADG